MRPWMIYGAYGYTGMLVCEQALRRGHRPVLAGRSAEALRRLAERLGLEHIVLDLQDQETLLRTVASFDLVFHAAGPFIHTSAPMVQACLSSGTAYLDITGEVPVLEQNLSYHQQARQRGMTLVSGCGFDVIPTDCLAKYVAGKVSDPTQLEIAIASTSGASSGTIQTMLEHMPQGILVRQDGQLIGRAAGRGARRVRFADRERTVLPINWGDLATAYRTTGIPNICVYMAYPKRIARVMRWSGFLIRRIVALGPVRRRLQKWVAKNIRGPDEHTRKTARSYLWARARNDQGQEAQAWLETLEAYQFTAVAGVRCVERILEEHPRGSLTPATAFGTDFVLEIPGTERHDRLDER